MTIQKFSNKELLSFPLEQNGIDTPSGQSVRQSKRIAITGCEADHFGVWEASPGTFTREVLEGEIMYILSGSATFQSAEGEVIDIAQGDTLVFSPNTRGEWRIHESLRKLYVLL